MGPASIRKKPQSGRGGELRLTPRQVEGVVILDSNLRILAFDDGAVAILKGSHQPAPGTEWAMHLPREILDSLQNGFIHDPASRKLRVCVGSPAYICRIHEAQSRAEGFPGRVTVLHLARDLSMADALSQIGVEYRLTARELQALEGVLLGLASKEVAERMNISPNTVRTFLRLIMSKMGVTSRSGIAAKLFELNGHW